MKGASVLDIEGETEAAGAAAAEALSNQKIPNSVKKHVVVRYFDQIRKGSNADRFRDRAGGLFR